MSQNGGRLLMKKRDMSMVRVRASRSKDVSRMKAKNDVMNDLQQKSKAIVALKVGLAFSHQRLVRILIVS